MTKIELTAAEIEVIKQQLNGEIEIFTATDEQQVLLSGVIEKAEALDEELGYQEYEDMIQWYYDLYLEQQKEEATE